MKGQMDLSDVLVIYFEGDTRGAKRSEWSQGTALWSMGMINCIVAIC